MSSEEPEMTEATETSKKGYGSKWKRWLLIYLVIGAIVYAIIYFAFISNGTGFSY